MKQYKGKHNSGIGTAPQMTSVAADMALKTKRSN
jgi:hypothetical protein